MSVKVDREELLGRLSDGIERLTTSDKWREYLDMQARFRRYSPRNIELILLQKPDATRVASYRTWDSLGRQVRKGEVSMRILAPMRYNLEDPETHETKPVLRGFRLVPVFDVSQTDGEPLPEVVSRLAGGDPNGLYEQLRRVAEGLGYSVESVELDGETNGDTTFKTRCIRVESRNAPAQRAKTLAHEIAHALLHDGVEGMTRNLIELEAESVAYVVCQSLELETGDYSFGYVTEWAGVDKVQDLILDSASRIQSAAKTIVATIEANAEADAAAAEATLTLATVNSVLADLYRVPNVETQFIPQATQQIVDLVSVSTMVVTAEMETPDGVAWKGTLTVAGEVFDVWQAGNGGCNEYRHAGDSSKLDALYERVKAGFPDDKGDVLDVFCQLVEVIHNPELARVVHSAAAEPAPELTASLAASSTVTSALEPPNGLEL